MCFDKKLQIAHSRCAGASGKLLQWDLCSVFGSHEARCVPSHTVIFFFHCKCSPQLPEENRQEKSHFLTIRTWMGKLSWRWDSYRRVTAERSVVSGAEAVHYALIQHLPNWQLVNSPFSLQCLELQRLFLVYSNTLAPFEDLKADIN